MMRQTSLSLLLATSAALILATSAGLVKKVAIPGYIDCVSSNDCGTTECCVLGTARFSIPSCQIRGEVGDPCSPISQPRNMSVSYLDGSVVQLVDVYSVVCACAPGLLCSPDSATCADPLAKQSLNELDD
ncbi:astakine-like [Schistocerca piceifrons]|uniref:astakine-like n=1 Tax=Schistocerca piceifrons TaxID=274613 RepID=UPI001F5F84D6|nr:astakine-like [Schistocerca piceifrons]